MYLSAGPNAQHTAPVNQLTNSMVRDLLWTADSYSADQEICWSFSVFIVEATCFKLSPTDWI